MKTLYVSDLDGTLLRSDETTSDWTNDTINELVEKGMLFSYATARSYQTAHKVTKGLNAKIPLIIYNGTMVVDNHSGKILLSNFFDKSDKMVLDTLLNHQIYPIVYSFIDGVEKFSYVQNSVSKGMNDFIQTRNNDPRQHPVNECTSLYDGDIFYITCIDEKRKLEPLYDLYKESYHCVFQKDVYTNEQWLEIMPKTASKAQAITQLKDYLQCEKLVVFGDGLNDLDMFEIADESYAVQNAADKLKKVATGIIGDNNQDAVAKWLKANYQ